MSPMSPMSDVRIVQIVQIVQLRPRQATERLNVQPGMMTEGLKVCRVYVEDLYRFIFMYRNV